MNNSQLLISDLPFHTINANGRGDKWNRFMDVFIISILMLLSGYWLLYRRLIVPEMNSNQEKKADIVKTATESLKKTLRRRQSWILTLLASVCLSVASVPYVLSLIYHYQLDLSLHPIVKWPSVDVAIHSFFCAYLLMDLLVGYWHYREQLQLLSGWIHHLVYMALVISLVHHEITAPFPYFAIMELPTVVLAIGHVWRDWRSDKLFGLAFFVTRLVYHSALIYQFCFRFPLRAEWLPLLAPLHSVLMLLAVLLATSSSPTTTAAHRYNSQTHRWLIALASVCCAIFTGSLLLLLSAHQSSAMLLIWLAAMAAGSAVALTIVYYSTDAWRNWLCVFWMLSITAELATCARTIILQPVFMAAASTITILLVNIHVALLVLINRHSSSAHYQPLSPAADDDVEEAGEECPQDQANFFQLLTFSWMNPLMRLGRDRPLTADDLWNCRPEDKSRRISVQFQQAWQRELNGANPSLFYALLAVFGREYSFSGLLKFCQDCVQFIQPKLLAMLIAFVANYSSGSSDIVTGIAIVLAMPMAACVQSLLLHQFFHRCMVVGMHVRSAVVTAIYRKSLALSNDSRQRYTTGEIVNLMSVDAQRFMELASFLHVLWSSPLQIGLALYFLYQTMGWSIFGGVLVMALMIPINAALAAVESRLEKRQMQNKDNRIKLIDELLNGIKALKLYAWESHFLSKIRQVREQELLTLKRIGYVNALDTFTWSCTPFLVAFATFAVHTVVRNEPLSPETVFVAISLFNLLQFPLSMLPYMISSVVEAAVSLRRVSNFLLDEELDANATERHSFVSSNAAAVGITNGNFSWTPGGGNDELHLSILKQINLCVPAGSLMAIIGKVGSGKSSLLSAVLGEMYAKAGSRITVNGNIAYAGQQPWILNATVRENIVFGQSMNEEYYRQTIKACALDVDIELLPAGDHTEIGERGINLSGGQKQRISLDDPLAAVDAAVGRRIFDQVLGPAGLLAKKTRLLVTHAIHLLPQCDLVVLMSDGQITEGPISFPESSEIHRLFDDHTQKESARGDVEQIAVPERVEIKPLEIKLSLPFSSDTEEEGKNIISTEAMSRGSVSYEVYLKYAKTSSLTAVGIALFLILAANGANVGSNFWLKRWADESSHRGVIDILFYLGIYAALGFTMSLLVILQVIIVWVYSAIRSARVLHEQMLQAIASARLQFFDITPLGRIMNRFSKDVYTVDEVLPRSFLSFFRTLFAVVSILIVISITTPLFLITILPMASLYYLIQSYYLCTSRELKRLDSVSKSPLFAHFSETLAGIQTIRAYQLTETFYKENELRVDANQRAYYPSIAANRWLALRLEFLGSMVIFASALFSLISLVCFDVLDAGVVGLSVSYAMTITQTLNWMVRQFCEIETNIVAVERLKEYIDLDREGGGNGISARNVDDSWPSNGLIEFRNYSARYREGLELALRDLSLTIRPGEKVGIVGRTGAGKSSMTLALFRIIEAAKGSILIDGIDIAQVELSRLRSRLTIIPQDPVLFGGSIRENLDPTGQCEDAELWQALRGAHLSDLVCALPLKLDAPILQGGENFSVGQRQLVCLARALLRQAKILVLDEATAAIDVDTDALIQHTIRTEFVDATVLTIAHRLNTVMDSDKILVLDQSNVKEFDKPAMLLSDPQSMFSQLVASS